MQWGAEVPERLDGRRTSPAVAERQLLDILVRFATTLTDDFSIHDVLDHLVEQVVHLLPVSGAGVLLMDGPIDHHFVSASDDRIRRVEGLQVRLREGPCLVAYETGRRVAISDLAADRTMPRFSPAALAAGLGAVFSFPLHHHGDRIGALELYAAEPIELHEGELDAAQTLADVVASYLLIARRREAAARTAKLLADAAMRDPLTGLPNRRLLGDRLEQAMDRSTRSGLPFAILFCDLDGFKHINDRYGHSVGDTALIDLADRLSGTLRPQDTLARVAGDEFVIVCEDIPGPDKAEEIAYRAAACLQEPFWLSASPGQSIRLELQMSIGVAISGVGHDPPERAFDRADRAMYAAKRLGGGRHVTATVHREPPPPSFSDAREADGATPAAGNVPVSTDRAAEGE